MADRWNDLQDGEKAAVAIAAVAAIAVGGYFALPALAAGGAGAAGGAAGAAGAGAGAAGAGAGAAGAGAGAAGAGTAGALMPVSTAATMGMASPGLFGMGTGAPVAGASGALPWIGTGAIPASTGASMGMAGAPGVAAAPAAGGSWLAALKNFIPSSSGEAVDYLRIAQMTGLMNQPQQPGAPPSLPGYQSGLPLKIGSATEAAQLMKGRAPLSIGGRRDDGTLAAYLRLLQARGA